MKKLFISGLLSCSLLFSGLIGEHKTEAATTSDKVANIALSFVGVPYQWGGTTPRGFDCSGFVGYTYKQVGIYLPRTSADQFNEGQAVSKSNIKEGDLVFFSTYKSGPSHVGIYLDNNRFIHASDSGVRVDTLSGNYWVKTYYGTKRVDPSANDGWSLTNGTWYFYKNGQKQTGWINDRGTWYYLRDNGAMATGWLYWKGDWYFLNQSGAMAKGWIFTGGKWYYLYNSGAMAKNTTIDGKYYVGKDGAWIK